MYRRTTFFPLRSSHSRSTLVLFLLVLLCFAGAFSRAHASHLSGGEITYTCLGNDNYTFTLRLYSDCSGVQDPPTSAQVRFNGPCGTFMRSFPREAVNEVSQLCAADMGGSTCNGGVLPGTTEHIYSDTVTLTPCDQWTIGVFGSSLGSRNASVLNLVNPTNQTMYFETTVNSLLAPCDNSPVIQSAPIPYVCLGTPVSYSFGALDADGDALSYALTGARAATGNEIPYAAGFSATAPIAGIQLNEATGEVTFTPDMQGSYVVAVRVEQRDGNGVLIGSVVRDMQFIVFPCAGTAPDAAAGAVEGLSGSVLSSTDNTINLCSDGAFCFNATYPDADAGSTLVIASNIAQVLPGATLASTGSNPIVATFCWNNTAGISGSFTFNVTITDCTPGSLALVQNYSYTVIVAAADPLLLMVSNDTAVWCAGEQARIALEGITGGTAPFNTVWSTDGGTVIGSQQAFFVPVVAATDFTVVVTDACAATASATVSASVAVHGPLVLEHTPDTVACSGGEVLLAAWASGGAGGYTIRWNGSVSIDGNLPVAPFEPTIYSVSATDACGVSILSSVLVSSEVPTTSIAASMQGDDQWSFTAVSFPAAMDHVWEFGNGETSSDRNPQHPYRDFQPHVVHLTITTANGCSATDTVHIAPAAHVYFPNAFTPNGDGLNDVFGVVGAGITALELNVFDRWGAMVFSTDSITAGWNGRLPGGGMAPNGVYVFQFRVFTGGAVPATGTGHVTLLGEGLAQY